MIWTIASIESASLLPWGVAIAASMVAAALDLRYRRIHNWLTGPVFVGGLAWSAAFGGLGGLWQSLGASLLLALPFILLFLFAGGGAADAKLMGAVGAWVGLANCAVVLLAVVISGAVLGIVYAILKRQAMPVLGNLYLISIELACLFTGQRDLQQTRQAMPQPVRMLTVPYGVAIFLGVSIAAMNRA